MEKHDYFHTPITRFQPDAGASLRDFVAAMGRTGGQPRRLAAAVDLWSAMLERQRIVFCSIAGAPVPLGFGPAIASLIEGGRIDMLDITGAQLTHDLLEMIGSKHFQGHVGADDVALAEQDVNRFWDTFGDEADYRRVEPMIFDFARRAARPADDDARVHLPHGRLLQEDRLAGRHHHRRVRPRHAGVLPGDRRLGAGDGPRASSASRRSKRIVFDVVQDVLEMAAIVLLAEEVGLRTSTVIFGGGSPRNHIQQSQIGTYMFVQKGKGHAEAVRFSIEPVETGGLSGSTVSEGISWKKFDPKVEAAEVFLDSNLSLAVTSSLVATRPADRGFAFQHEDDGTLTVLHDGKSYNLSEKFGF